MMQDDHTKHRRKQVKRWLLRCLIFLLAGLYAVLSIVSSSNTISADYGLESTMRLPRQGMTVGDEMKFVDPVQIMGAAKLTQQQRVAGKEKHDIQNKTQLLNGDNQSLSIDLSGRTAAKKITSRRKPAKITRTNNTNKLANPVHQSMPGRKPTTKGIRVRGGEETRLQIQLGCDLDGSDIQLTEAYLHSLQQFYNRSIASATTSDEGLWKDHWQGRIPEWMATYFQWHGHMRQSLVNETMAGDLKLIVLQCLSTDPHCGGVSDRLKPLPLLLRWAYYSKRVLLIYWNRPGHLEEFLVPPRGGLDWRAPPWLIEQMEDAKQGVLTFNLELLRAWSRTNTTVVRSRFQDYHGGQYAYDEHLRKDEPDFRKVFHHVWRTAFTPSPPVRDVLESDMRKLALKPGRFVGAHLRVLYGMKDRDESIKKAWAENAMNCASELRPSRPIFFVSDSRNATYYAKEYGILRNATVITRTPNPNPPFHMDKVHDWRRRNISDFYDSFVDIYIMGSADCLTYNKGGYGLLGLFMSHNPDCGLRQDAINKAAIKQPCIWVDSIENGTQATRDSLSRNSSIGSNEYIYMY